jgi:hypothetical protein
MLSQKKITKKDMRIDEKSKENKGEREREERERERERVSALFPHVIYRNSETRSRKTKPINRFRSADGMAREEREGQPPRYRGTHKKRPACARRCTYRRRGHHSAITAE